mmetsp:Transcript_31550/g.51036  ORF Transcript_31550/g.51036 Transcript_31550/m.51036 type:complete len:142 (-) Transcript_31550:1409-1834(-)
MSSVDSKSEDPTTKLSAQLFLGFDPNSRRLVGFMRIERSSLSSFLQQNLSIRGSTTAKATTHNGTRAGFCNFYHTTTTTTHVSWNTLRGYTHIRIITAFSLIPFALNILVVLSIRSTTWVPCTVQPAMKSVLIFLCLDSNN